MNQIPSLFVFLASVLLSATNGATQNIVNVFPIQTSIALTLSPNTLSNLRDGISQTGGLAEVNSSKIQLWKRAIGEKIRPPEIAEQTLSQWEKKNNTEISFPTSSNSTNVIAQTTSSVTITVLPNITYYIDSDGDNYGNINVTQTACSGAPIGYVTDNTDCDDTNPNINPGTSEICNGIDDNCDGSIDEGLQSTFYQDSDNDGQGNALVSQMSCGPLSGYVANNTDCNDNDPLNAAPAKPSPGIFNPGQRNLCSESNITLSVLNDPSASSYTWTLAPGFSGASTSNFIVVSPSGTFGQATFTVTANNGCGSSPFRNINIWGTPNKPIVSGPTCVNQNQTGITYTVSNAEPGVTYTWTLPNNVANQTPLTGTSITVDWNRPNPAKIKVIGSNSCGLGLRGSLAISVGGCNITAKSEQQVLVYPNPTSGQTNVLLTVNKDSKATIVVFDVAGQQLQRKEWVAMAGQNRISIDMSAYPNGMYLFSIITTEGVQTLKVIKGQ